MIISALGVLEKNMSSNSLSSTEQGVALAARLEQLDPESEASLDATITCLKELRDRGLEAAHSPVSCEILAFV